MEDEDGYMVLKPKKELGKQNNLSQMQAHNMADEVVSYANLRLTSERTSARLPHPSQGYNAFSYPRCQWIALLIGWAANIFLIITVIVLVFQMAQQTSETGNKTYMEKEQQANVSHLKQFLCKSPDYHATENSRCRLCPQNWSLHRKKCYWISKENRTWHKSKKDCSAKLSHMLVIENQDEVAFIQTIVEGAHLLWIGLTATFPERKWTWVNGSQLDEKMLQAISPVEANSCGQLNENQIVPEACSAVARWICKTDSLII